jgi:hypothetical protein
MDWDARSAFSRSLTCILVLLLRCSSRYVVKVLGGFPRYKIQDRPRGRFFIGLKILCQGLNFVLMDSSSDSFPESVCRKRGHRADLQPSKNKSFEIPSSVFRIAINDLDLFGTKIRFVFAGDTEISCFDMKTVLAEFIGQKHFFTISLNNSIGHTLQLPRVFCQVHHQ